jgi:hypothetical protein
MARLGLVQFSDQLDLDTSAHRQLGHSKGAAGMGACFAHDVG